MGIFKCLYNFTSKDISVLEIKRMDVPSDAPLSRIYKWLVLSSKKVFELHFQSMHKDEYLEFRTFTEGEFKFNSNEGHLRWLGKEFLLERKDTDEVSVESLELVKNYLIKN